ncbi:hypothetical protein TNCV_4023371 [Trichonephila clavipes]|nr:hypothetical protein TNCV_4023371 [Trichonephila clavipes]
MYASSSSVNPTPLAHADTPRDILPRGGISQSSQSFIPTNLGHVDEQMIPQARGYHTFMAGVGRIFQAETSAVKSIQAQSPPVCVVSKFGDRGVPAQSVILVTRL